MWYPDDVQHLAAVPGLVDRLVVRWTRTRSPEPSTATTSRASSGRPVR
jgi:hypothetical protein